MGTSISWASASSETVLYAADSLQVEIDTEVSTTVKLAQTILASALTDASNVITRFVTTNFISYYTVLCCVTTMPLHALISAGHGLYL